MSQRYEITPQRRAFLDVIAKAEGTFDRPNSGYNTQFTGRQFNDLSRHPRTRIKSGGYTSSAAGRYQIMDFTEDGLIKEGFSPDFSAESQDQKALRLIERRGGLQAVDSGDLDTAFQKLNKEWASFPGSPYGQPTKSADELKAFYQQRLGQPQTAQSTPQVQSGQQAQQSAPTQQQQAQPQMPTDGIASAVQKAKAFYASNPYDATGLFGGKSQTESGAQRVAQGKGNFQDWTNFYNDSWAQAANAANTFQAQQKSAPPAQAQAIQQSTPATTSSASVQQASTSNTFSNARPGHSVFSGNTGTSTGAHLDFRVKSADGEYLDPNKYKHLVMSGDKKVSESFRVTSPWGMRNHPVHGTRKMHHGIDYGTPEGTPLTVQGAQFLRMRDPSTTAGGGWVAEYKLPGGEIAQLLHLQAPK